MTVTTFAVSDSDRYRIERELGAGGMATVYLAEDLRHRRRVALKVLRPELCAVIGAERFLKEIEITANLQHPHILPLHDSGRTDGTAFYVMPFVEGETLRDRLTRERQLPIDAAVRIALEVADALGYAHAHGVIHRDVKPENILLTAGSTGERGTHALVADFGIALAVSAAGGQRLTEIGLPIGTPAYMSPEQATGERGVDARTDIYALGAVVYEMLAGVPPFTAPGSQAMIARVLTDEPKPLVAQRRTVPHDLDAAVRTALEKLPADRFSSAEQFAAALSSAVAGGAAAAERRRSVSRSRARIGVAAAIATVAAGAFVGGRAVEKRAGANDASLGRATRVTWESGLEVQPAISPDGRFVAYAAGTSAILRVFVRQVTGGRATPLTNDTVDVQTNPSWSPDGARVLYLARGGVFSAPSSGGTARPEVPASTGRPIASAAWSPDGSTVAYSAGDSLFTYAAARGAQPLARIHDAALCKWSPNGEFIACASGNAYYLSAGRFFGNLSPSRIVIARVSDGVTTTVTDSTAMYQSPVWAVDGRSLYVVSNRDGPGDVYRVPLDASARPAGRLARLTTGLSAQSIALSADGSRLAYAVLSETRNVWSMPLPANPPVSNAAATPVTKGNQVIERTAVSRDGKWLVYSSDVAGSADVYRLPLPGGEPERLTTDPGDEFSPDMSPDGREVAYHSWNAGSRDVYIQPLDGRPAQRITSTPKQEAGAVWSPDGTAIAFMDFTGSGGVLITRRGPNGAWGTPVQRTDRGWWPSWSPDGKWLALGSELLGGSLLVVSTDSGRPRTLIDASVTGSPRAEQSEWSADGRTIYFNSHDERSNGSFWSIPASGGTPTQLVRVDDPARPSYRPEWALRNNRLYFTIDQRESDVWVIEIPNH